MRFYLGLVLLAATWGAEAQIAVPDGVPETIYTINSTSTDVKTTVKNILKYDNSLQDFTLPMIKEALLKTQFVSSIEEINGPEVPGTVAATYTPYNSFKRDSSLIVSLRLPTRVSLLFKAEEEYRVCAATPAAPVSYSPTGGGYDHGSGSSESTQPVSACQLLTTTKIKGPLAVYGFHASAVDLDKLLKNKQEVFFSIGKSSDKKNFEILSRFTISSVRWEDSMFRFIEAFGLMPAMSDENISPLAGAVTPMLVSRQSILLGVSRYARQINSELLAILERGAK